jgi:thiamine biosynthesis lipoprotein
VPADLAARELTVSTTAMASQIAIWVAPDPADDPTTYDAVLAEALAVFHRVDRTCTRFDDTSDLMRANADPNKWHVVSPTCFDALVAAYSAYRRTNGRFDPRVLDDLVRLGYDRSLTVRPPRAHDGVSLVARGPLQTWEPQFRRERLAVRLGNHPVDLGGIGKGLAVRWASAVLAGAGRGHLVTAGGDCRAVGSPPDGDSWRVAVEDPDHPADSLAVLAVRDGSVATSSIRIRQWQVGDRSVHHLVDPSTGLPGGAGLVAVTVVDDDPADAETWSKVLFLTGRRGIATSAEHFGIAALWVDADRTVSMSPSMRRHLLWTAS